MTKAERIEQFNYFSEIITRDGIVDLMYWLENETDFYEAPASSIHHNNYDGGLADHSINVLKIFVHNYKWLKENYELPKMSKESIYIICLFHDVCKVNSYNKETCWTKDDGKWRSYQGYKLDENPYGHGEQSVRLIEKFMKLSDVEALCIRHHMGTYESNEKLVWKTFNTYPLARLLHTADMMSLCIEKTIDLKNE